MSDRTTTYTARREAVLLKLALIKNRVFADGLGLHPIKAADVAKMNRISKALDRVGKAAGCEFTEA